MRFIRGTARLVLPALLAGGLAVAGHAPAPADSSAVALPPVELAVSGYSRSVPLPARSTCLPATCVNATAHGADGTDRLSDSGALTAAAAAASAAKKVLWLPAGTYVLTTPFRPPAGLTLAGAGIDRTVLKIDWASVRAGAFGYSFAVHARPEGGGDKVAGVTVQDLTVHGSRNESGCADATYSDASDPDPLACKVNQAGGIGTGPGWTVRQVRLTNLNYFKIGIFGVDGVKVLHCRFDDDDPGSSSGGEDNIGGGSEASHILVEGNRWAPSAVGNALDLTVANDVVTRGNSSWGPSIIYEGVRGGRIENNVLTGAHGINLKPNAHYEEHSVPTYGIVHTTGVTVSGNRITDPYAAGIAVMYFPTGSYTQAVAKGTLEQHVEPPTTTPGGGNVVRGNTIIRPSGLGIVVAGARGAVFTRPDRIEGNTITDVDWRKGAGYGGWFPHPTGIGVTGAAGSVIGRNTVIDTRAGAPVTTGAASLAVPAPTGPQTGSAVIVGAASPGPNVSPDTAVVHVAPQTVRGLWAEPVRWHVAVPTAVSRPDERGATVTVTGYGLDRVDRRAGVTLDGVALTGVSAPTAPDATGLSTLTAVVPPGTGTGSLALRTTDGRRTSATTAVRYGPGVDPTLPPGTVLSPAGGSVRVTTSVPVGDTASAFSASGWRRRSTASARR